MIKRLIVNADDFGLTSDINRAIIEAHQKGIVTSTTILGNCDPKLLEDAVELSKQNPKLGVGAHLVLTLRKPLLDASKSLTDPLGNFRVNILDDIDEIDVEVIYQEWKAQLNYLLNHFKLTHIDSHHHVHTHKKLYPVATRLSKEYKLPLRSIHDNFPFGIKTAFGFYNEGVALEYIKDVVLNEKGLLELMVHPGYKDDSFLQEISSYHDMRQRELDILCMDELKSFLDEHEIELVNYSYIHLK